MKKIFFVAGELSGDRIAAWYVHKTLHDQSVVMTGVGGDAMEKAGIKLIERFENLNVTGVMEIVRHLRRLLRIRKKLIDYIIEGQIDEVVLVDFPGFNLGLAKLLKKNNPSISITYVSPPQLWCWGVWRVKTIKKVCDRVVVMYPFEVDWYRKRDVHAEWLGSPVYEELKPYLAERLSKHLKIALIPGSRHSEVQTVFPIILQVAKRIHNHYPQCSFVIPIASSISAELVEQQFLAQGIALADPLFKRVYSHEDKYQELKKCCLALTKPGTITLELALLGVPSLVLFKTSWITYILARPLVKVQNMGLHNLLLDAPVCREFIQSDCTSERVATYALTVLDDIVAQGALSQQLRVSLDRIRALFVERS